MVYRAVNTLDSLLGYRGAYEYLGKFAARLDDVVNLVPARISALLILAGGALSRPSVRRGWRIMLRDRRRTASPNAGLTMSAMAGLLGIQLEKPGHYRLGEGLREAGLGRCLPGYAHRRANGITRGGRLTLGLLLRAPGGRGLMEERLRQMTTVHGGLDPAELALAGTSTRSGPGLQRQHQSLWDHPGASYGQPLRRICLPIPTAVASACERRSRRG